MSDLKGFFLVVTVVSICTTYAVVSGLKSRPERGSLTITTPATAKVQAQNPAQPFVITDQRVLEVGDKKLDKYYGAEPRSFVTLMDTRNGDCWLITIFKDNKPGRPTGDMSPALCD